MLRLLLALPLVLALPACGGDGGAPPDANVTVDSAATWGPPTCSSITGTGGVSFTHDDGATLASMDVDLQPTTYTFGVVTLGQPGGLRASVGEDLVASDDGGCTWRTLGASGSGTMVLRAAGDRVYGFGDNEPVVVRLDGDTITTLAWDGGGAGVVGLGTDPVDLDHVRLGDSAGVIWDSTDAGAHWTAIGVAALDSGTSLAYRAAFDPADLDHALFGVMSDGIAVTTDGGATWAPATGLSTNGRANGFQVAVSPAQGTVVWAEGYDLSNLDDATARHVYRSTDGGATFTPVVDAADAILFNGNPLFPHPTDPDVLYFTYGTGYQNYGTDVFRYDVGTDVVTHTHNRWHRVNAIAFLPGDPAWMWFGLSMEPG